MKIDTSKDHRRVGRARELAGLSIGQAARLLGMSREKLVEIEEHEPAFADADHKSLADFYGVSVAWLTGEVPWLDYEAVNRLPGGRELPFHDRDILAEVFAMQLRRPK